MSDKNENPLTDEYSKAELAKKILVAAEATAEAAKDTLAAETRPNNAEAEMAAEISSGLAAAIEKQKSDMTKARLEMPIIPPAGEYPTKQ